MERETTRFLCERSNRSMQWHQGRSRPPAADSSHWRRPRSRSPVSHRRPLPVERRHGYGYQPSGYRQSASSVSYARQADRATDRRSRHHSPPSRRPRLEQSHRESSRDERCDRQPSPVPGRPPHRRPLRVDRRHGYGYQPSGYGQSASSVSYAGQADRATDRRSRHHSPPSRRPRLVQSHRESSRDGRRDRQPSPVPGIPYFAMPTLRRAPARPSSPLATVSCAPASRDGRCDRQPSPAPARPYFAVPTMCRSPARPSSPLATVSCAPASRDERCDRQPSPSRVPGVPTVCRTPASSSSAVPTVCHTPASSSSAVPTVCRNPDSPSSAVATVCRTPASSSSAVSTVCRTPASSSSAVATVSRAPAPVTPEPCVTFPELWGTHMTEAMERELDGWREETRQVLDSDPQTARGHSVSGGSSRASSVGSSHDGSLSESARPAETRAGSKRSHDGQRQSHDGQGCSHNGERRESSCAGSWRDGGNKRSWDDVQDECPSPAKMFINTSHPRFSRYE